MTNEEIAIKLEDHEHEIGSLKHRMKTAEESNQILHRLTTAVEVMATKQDSMGESVDRLNTKVDALEKIPGKRWDSLVDKAIWAVAGAFIAWILAGMPGG